MLRLEYQYSLKPTSSEIRNLLNVLYVAGPKRARIDCKGGYVKMLKI